MIILLSLHLGKPRRRDELYLHTAVDCTLETCKPLAEARKCRAPHLVIHVTEGAVSAVKR